MTEKDTFQHSKKMKIKFREKKSQIREKHVMNTLQGWDEWSGATQLATMLARKYELRKVACYKGVNVSPDVFKYIILIEFLIIDGMLFEIAY